MRALADGDGPPAEGSPIVAVAIKIPLISVNVAPVVVNVTFQGTERMPVAVEIARDLVRRPTVA